MWDLSFLTRDQTWAPTVKALRPVHWSTRDFLINHLKKKKNLGNFLVAQCLGLGVFTAMGLGLIPDGGTKNCNMTLAPSKKL